jgi:Fanconi anemia group J protein
MSPVIDRQVSEGIDFADGRARCVMVVGIPYPHAKDSKVALKKDYNNASAAAAARLGMGPGRQQQYGGGRGAVGVGGGGGGGPAKVLTGDAWYSQQAFRALNQVCVWVWCVC